MAHPDFNRLPWGHSLVSCPTTTGGLHRSGLGVDPVRWTLTAATTSACFHGWPFGWVGDGSATDFQMGPQQTPWPLGHLSGGRTKQFLSPGTPHGSALEALPRSSSHACGATPHLPAPSRLEDGGFGLLRALWPFASVRVLPWVKPSSGRLGVDLKQPGSRLSLSVLELHCAVRLARRFPL